MTPPTHSCRMYLRILDDRTCLPKTETQFLEAQGFGRGVLGDCSELLDENSWTKPGTARQKLPPTLQHPSAVWMSFRRLHQLRATAMWKSRVSG